VQEKNSRARYALRGMARRLSVLRSLVTVTEVIMDYLELLLVDRVRTIASELRHLEMIDYMVAVDAPAMCEAIHRQRIMDDWEQRHPVDDFLTAAMDELNRLAQIVRGKTPVTGLRFGQAANG